MKSFCQYVGYSYEFNWVNIILTTSAILKYFCLPMSVLYMCYKGTSVFRVNIVIYTVNAVSYHANAVTCHAYSLYNEVQFKIIVMHLSFLPAG